MICKKCGTVLPGVARWCENCGENVVPEYGGAIYSTRKGHSNKIAIVAWTIIVLAVSVLLLFSQKWIGASDELLAFATQEENANITFLENKGYDLSDFGREISSIEYIKVDEQDFQMVNMKNQCVKIGNTFEKMPLLCIACILAAVLAMVLLYIKKDKFAMYACGFAFLMYIAAIIMAYSKLSELNGICVKMTRLAGAERVPATFYEIKPIIYLGVLTFASALALSFKNFSCVEHGAISTATPAASDMPVIESHRLDKNVLLAISALALSIIMLFSQKWVTGVDNVKVNYDDLTIEYIKGDRSISEFKSNMTVRSQSMMMYAEEMRSLNDETIAFYQKNIESDDSSEEIQKIREEEQHMNDMVQNYVSGSEKAERNFGWLEYLNIGCVIMAMLAIVLLCLGKNNYAVIASALAFVLYAGMVLIAWKTVRDMNGIIASKNNAELFYKLKTIVYVGVLPLALSVLATFSSIILNIKKKRSEKVF